MRIIGGKWRRRRLTPVGKGDTDAHLRPTSDRLRESLFNLLVNGGYGNVLDQARVLDAFAGTGALGFEALSRGADCATFLDTGHTARALISQNAKTLDAHVTLLPQDATHPGPCPISPHNLIFLDPPYGKSLGEKAMTALLAEGWISADALILWEENSAKHAPVGFVLLDQRRYGSSFLHVLRADDA